MPHACDSRQHALHVLQKMFFLPRRPSAETCSSSALSGRGRAGTWPGSCTSATASVCGYDGVTGKFFSLASAPGRLHKCQPLQSTRSARMRSHQLLIEIPMRMCGALSDLQLLHFLCIFLRRKTQTSKRHAAATTCRNRCICGKGLPLNGAACAACHSVRRRALQS